MTDAAPMSDTDCLFCRIVAGEIPSTMVLQSEAMVAFRDIAPEAPTHVLVVSRAHHADVSALAAASPTLLAEMIDVARRVADSECGGQFRLVFNVGPEAGQTVPHVHAHVLGGAPMGRVLP
jgi:histidine triad (HIT) family protein